MALFGFKQFKNPHINRINRSFVDYLFWQLGFYKDKKELPSLPSDFVYPTVDETKGEGRVTWINHSTFLVEYAGLTFLTDPIFAARCSPIPFFGPKRHHPPFPSLDKLPKIDFVLISHNHYDHLDKSAIRWVQRANPEVKWIVPMGVKRWLAKRVPKESITELGWHESAHFNEVVYTSVPAQHFSGRGLFDKNRSLWMGIVVEVKQKRFYFAGDTGYNEVDFKEIGKRFKSMDLSLLPIGVYLPRGFMQGVHVSPKEAIKIHEEVCSQLSVGGHWKTFKLSEEDIERPPFDLYCALQERGLSEEDFRVISPGETIAW